MYNYSVIQIKYLLNHFCVHLEALPKKSLKFKVAEVINIILLIIQSEKVQVDFKLRNWSDRLFLKLLSAPSLLYS